MERLSTHCGVCLVIVLENESLIVVPSLWFSELSGLGNGEMRRMDLAEILIVSVKTARLTEAGFLASMAPLFSHTEHGSY